MLLFRTLPISLFATTLLLLTFFLTANVNATPNFCGDQQDPKPIFCQDFQHRDEGLYTPENLAEDWPNLQSLSTKVFFSNMGVGQQRVNVVDHLIDNKNEKYNSRMLKIKYPKKRFGSALSGATWVMEFPHKYEQLSLEYKVMFEKGFLYNREGLFGGKLPGLMGGETISGGASADGTNGWTARLMWGQMGRGLGYLYYPDMRDDKYNQNACPRYGLNHELCVIKRNKYFTFDSDSSKKCISEWASDDYEFRFDTEHFYKIKQFIKMNTIPGNSLLTNADGFSFKKAEGSAQGNRDGQMKIWIDDKLVVDCTNIRFRDISELAIDSLLFSTFFGGNTAESSAHPHDEYIYYDDFVVRTE